MNKEKTRIVVMGGSFNPPTTAHYRLMEVAVRALDAHIGFFVPVSDAYLKRKMRHSHPPVVLSPELRVEMLRSICGEDNRLQVWTREMDAVAATTTETMMAIQTEYPDAALYFVMGADKLELLSHLAEKRGFLDAFNVLLFAREENALEEVLKGNDTLAGYQNRIVVLPQPEGTEGVSSSAVRARMLSGASSQDLLCPGVWALFKAFTAADFPDVINRFKDDYAFLSNRFPCQLAWQGRQFGSADAAFRASNATEENRLDIMRSILEAKFGQNPALKAMLKATAGRLLINGNNSKEAFWGVDLYSWKGENHLGKILMSLREDKLTAIF